MSDTVGEMRKTVRRAGNFLEQLRGPGGWRDVTAQLLSGGTGRIYIGIDTEHAHDEHQESTRHPRSVVPQHTFYPQRRGGVVAARYRPIMKLDERQDCTTLLFNEAVFARDGDRRG